MWALFCHLFVCISSPRHGKETPERRGAAGVFSKLALSARAHTHTHTHIRILKEKGPCGCSRQCVARIPAAARSRMRAEFTRLKSIREEKIFLTSLIKLKRRKFVGPSLETRRRARRQRLFTASYFLKHESEQGDKTRVCCFAFQSILGIGSKRLKNLNEFNFRQGHKGEGSSLTSFWRFRIEILDIDLCSFSRWTRKTRWSSANCPRDYRQS